MTGPIVETKYGKVEGFIENGIRKWYGIPYAKPPVGDLRFRRAVECEPWQDVKSCKQFRSQSYQFKLSKFLNRNVSEDCLYLNIWKKDNEAKNLPVFVCIHGGYLHLGSGSFPLYHGNYYAEDGVIFVSLNYRLGALGCYDFSIYNKKAFDSNCCLSDQIMALKWINENIEAFGGDPHNITINGESAGGLSTLALMVSPAAKGLFQKAICQSGYPDGIQSRKSNKLLMDMFLEYLKISPEKPEEVEKIKEMDVQKLISASEYVLANLSRYPGIIWPGHVYDDDLLPEDCYQAIKNGSSNGVKLIIGTCKNEATLFNLFHEVTQTKEEMKKMFENNNLSSKFDKVEDYYFTQKKGGDHNNPALNFGRDYLFLMGSVEFADEFSKNNNDVYMYRFDFEPILYKLLNMKACHAVDVYTAYKNENIVNWMVWILSRPSSIKIMKDLMYGSWINFAKTGNPNGVHLNVQWEKYDSESRKTLLFDRAPTLIENPDKEKIELWQYIGTHQFYNKQIKTE